MQLKNILLTGLMATLSLGRAITSPSENQSGINQIFDRAPSVNVAMGSISSVQITDAIATTGLDTCVGMLAVGQPDATKKIGKILAHVSPATQNLFTTWSQQVKDSKMTNIKVYISQADVTRMSSMSDAEVKNNLGNQEATAQQIKDFKNGFVVLLTKMNAAAKTAATSVTPIGGGTYTRKNADAAKPTPYGMLYSTAAGQVGADRTNMGTYLPVAAAPASGH